MAKHPDGISKSKNPLHLQKNASTCVIIVFSDAARLKKLKAKLRHLSERLDLFALRNF